MLNEAVLDATLAGKDVPAKIREAMSRAQADLDFANSGMEAAQAIHAAALDADQRARRADKIAQIGEYLSAREANAAELAAAIENAVTAWRSLLENSERAEAVGLILPQGSMVGTAASRRAVEHELYRLGRDTSNRGLSFPGGQTPSFNNIDNPAEINPLVDELKQATAFTIATLKAQSV